MAQVAQAARNGTRSRQSVRYHSQETTGARARPARGPKWTGSRPTAATSARGDNQLNRHSARLAGAAAMTLIDSWMPTADVATLHSVRILAPVEKVYHVLLSTDFGRLPLVALLMGLRTLPAILMAPVTTWRRLLAARRPAALPLRALLNQDFVLLEERAPLELVLGLTGRFWSLSGGLLPTDAASFRHPPPPGTARGAWSFRLEGLPGGATRLVTETRVRCSDDATLRRFRRYWRLVAPGSSLIRRSILYHVRRRAETGGNARASSVPGGNGP